MTRSETDIQTADVVEVRVPAHVDFVSTLRLTAASLGSRCNLTVDEIEDLRLAVDEASALLLPHAAPDAGLEARFVLGGGRILVEVSVATTAAGVLGRSGFAWTVLGALANSVEVQTEATRSAITLTKRRA